MDNMDEMHQTSTVCVGEDLYGLSLHELEARIATFESEIIRVKRELEKKRIERSAADSLFSSKN